MRFEVHKAVKTAMLHWVQARIWRQKRFYPPMSPQGVTTQQNSIAQIKDLSMQCGPTYCYFPYLTPRNSQQHFGTQQISGFIYSPIQQISGEHKMKGWSDHFNRTDTAWEAEDYNITEQNLQQFLHWMWFWNIFSQIQHVFVSSPRRR